VTFEEDCQVKQIGLDSFLDSSVQSIQIPKGVEIISGAGLTGIKSVSIEEGNQHLSCDGICIYDITKRRLIRLVEELSEFEVPKEVEVICECSFECHRQLRELTFAADCGLKRIEMSALDCSRVKSIQIPKGVEFICGSALIEIPSVSVEEGNEHLSCDGICIYDITRRRLIRLVKELSEFEVPKEVEVICESCFDYHRQLREVTFPDDSQLTTIEFRAFDATEIESIRIPKGVAILCKSCFQDCPKLQRVEFEIDCKLKRIESCTFQSSSVSSIRIPKGVEVLGKRCFARCRQLREVTFEENCELKRIERLAFFNSSIGTIRIPKRVEVIGSRCFCSCGDLREVIFEEDCELKRIESNAFRWSLVQSIVIPAASEIDAPLAPHVIRVHVAAKADSMT
jgi:hypothetical protein